MHGKVEKLAKKYATLKIFFPWMLKIFFSMDVEKKFPWMLDVDPKGTKFLTEVPKLPKNGNL